MKDQFEIKVRRLHWVADDGKDDETDLCVHGEVYLRIGDTVISAAQEQSWTSSSTALYLMRTVDSARPPESFTNQLLPCCGHVFIEAEDEESAIILGCPNGIFWNIEHIEGDLVKHTTELGEEGVISEASYKKQVIEFADTVKAFYDQSAPKVVEEDDDDYKGYKAFWREWNRLRIDLDN